MYHSEIKSFLTQKKGLLMRSLQKPVRSPVLAPESNGKHISSISSHLESRSVGHRQFLLIGIPTCSMLDLIRAKADARSTVKGQSKKINIRQVITLTQLTVFSISRII